MSILADFKTASPKPKAWSGVYGYRPDKSFPLKMLGEIYAVISIKAEIEFDLANMGNLLLDELQAAYYTDVTEEVGIEQLEDALRAVEKRLEMILEREPELAKKGIDFEMMVAVIKKNTIYLGAVGEAKVFVARGNDIAEISSVLIDPEMGGFARTGSMILEPNDRLLLLTGDAMQQLGEEASKKVVAEFNLADIEMLRGSSLTIGYEFDNEWKTKIESRKKKEEPEAEVDEVEEKDRLKPELVKPPVEELLSQQTDIIEDSEDKPIIEEAGEEEKTEKVIMPFEVRDEVEAVVGVEEEVSEVGPSLVTRFSREANKARQRALLGLTNVRQGVQARIPRRGKKNVEEWEPSENDEFVVPNDIGEFIPDDFAESGLAVAAPGRLTQLTSAVRTSGANLVDKFRSSRPGSREDLVRSRRQGGNILRRLFNSVAGPGTSANRWRIGAIVLVVAVVVVIFGIRQTIQDTERRNYIANVEGQIALLQTNLDELSIDISEAVTNSAQESTMQELFASLANLKKSANDLLVEEIGVENLQNLISQIQKEEDTILRINAFSDAEIVTDLGVNNQGVVAKEIVYTNGKLYVLDQEKGVIYRLTTTLNSEANIFVSGLSNPSSMTTDQNKDIVFVDENKSSVVGTIDIGTGKIRRHPGLSAAKVGQISSLFVWKNNSTLYSINQKQQTIIKQAPISGNYQIPGSGSIWRKDPDLANGIDLYVNGSIYVLIDGKGIKRYWGGNPAKFELKGLLSEDLAATKQAVAFEFTSNQLFIADSENNRILRFSLKSGGEAVYEFLEQIIYRGDDNVFQDIRDIVFVNANQKKRLYVLDGTKVIRVNL